LLALAGAHHFVDVSRLRVKEITDVLILRYISRGEQYTISLMKVITVRVICTGFSKLYPTFTVTDYNNLRSAGLRKIIYLKSYIATCMHSILL
jgi:hypothetical protein